MSDWTLYNRPGSGGFVVEAALAMAGFSFELIELDSKPGTPLPESFAQVNPWRQVPSLRMPDGSLMTETAAIIAHLSAVAPGTRVGPAPGSAEHAQFLRWLVFASVNVYEAVLRRSYPFRFTDDGAAEPSVQRSATGRMEAALDVLEQAVVGPCFQGATFSALDVYIGMLWAWSRSSTERPKLDAVLDNVRNDAVTGPLWRRHYGDR